MMMYTVIFTTLALSLSMPKDATSAPIILIDEPIPSSLLKNDSTPKESALNLELIKNEELNPQYDKETTQKKEEAPSLEEKISSSKITKNSESLNKNSQPSTVINYDDLRNNIISELLENQSILDNYDLASYQETLHELINGTQIIPMQLSMWKSNIDNLVYSESEIESLIYHIESLSNAKDKNKRNNKSNYNPSDWDVFFNSIYFTWIKIIFILTVFSIIIRDFIRLRRSKKPKTSIKHKKVRSRHRYG